MSYDIDVGAFAQMQLDLKAMKAERDANWSVLDRMRQRLRAVVPEVQEGGDLVGAVLARLSAAEAAREAVERECGMPLSMIATTLNAHRVTAQEDHERAEAAESKVEAAGEYLAEQEWSAWRSSDGGREDFVGAACCPECAGMESVGHEAGCKLAALLARLRSSSPRTTPPEDARDLGSKIVAWHNAGGSEACAEAALRARLAHEQKWSPAAPATPPEATATACVVSWGFKNDRGETVSEWCSTHGQPMSICRASPTPAPEGGPRDAR